MTPELAIFVMLFHSDMFFSDLLIMLFMLLQNLSLVFFDTKSSSKVCTSFICCLFFAVFFLRINRAFNNIFSAASCNCPLSSWSSDRYVFLDTSEPKEDLSRNHFQHYTDKLLDTQQLVTHCQPQKPVLGRRFHTVPFKDSFWFCVNPLRHFCRMSSFVSLVNIGFRAPTNTHARLYEGA